MPTVVIGNNTGDDYSGVDDTYLSGYLYYQNNNYESETTGTVGYEAESSERPCNVLIKFPVSSISGPVAIDSLTIRIKNWTGSGGAEIALRRLLRNVVYDEATWNNYSSGNSWGTGGGIGTGVDIASDASATFDSVAFSSSYIAISGAQLLSDYEDRINGTLSNYGEHYHYTESSYPNIAIRTSEADDGDRPYLTVTYTESSGGHPAASRFRGMHRNNNVRYA